MGSYQWSKLTLFSAACAYVVWTGVDLEYRFIDGVNLLFHEAGHVVFAVFGAWVGYLGGTLGQLFFPIACTLYFLAREQRLSAAVTTLWLAESLFNIALYVADARTQQLPLVGGGDHDWHYLLGSVGLLEQDRVLSGGVRVVGFIIIAAALKLGLDACRLEPDTSAPPPGATP